MVNTQTVVLVLLGVLVLVAGIQAYQTNALLQTLASKDFAGLAAAGSVNAQSSLPQKQSVLSSLPTQVGGCG